MNIFCINSIYINVPLYFYIPVSTVLTKDLRLYSMYTFCMLPQACHVGIYFSTVWAWEVARQSSSVPLLMLLSNVLLQTGIRVVKLVTLIAGKHFHWTWGFPVFQSEVLEKERVNQPNNLSNIFPLSRYLKNPPASCWRSTYRSFHIENRWKEEILQQCCWTEASLSRCSWLSHSCDATNSKLESMLQKIGF